MLDTLRRRLGWPLDRRRGDTGRERPVVTPAKARASETHSNAVFQSDRVRLDGHGRAGRLVPLPQGRSGDMRDRCVGVELANEPAGVDATGGEHGCAVCANVDLETNATGHTGRADDIPEAGAVEVFQHCRLLVPIGVELHTPLLQQYSRVVPSRIERPPAEVTFHAPSPFSAGA